MTRPEAKENVESNNDLLQQAIGDVGPWQIVITMALSLVKIAVAWHQLAILFLAPPQEFWCNKPPDWSDVNTTYWRDVSRAVDSTGRGSCRRLNNSLDEFLLDGTIDLQKTVKCDRWEFDTSIFSTTITQEWTLVCDREILTQTAQMTYMLGILLGSLIFGMLADRYGRRKPLICSVVLQAAAGVGTAFATNLTMFSVLRFIDALATAGSMASFVIVMEIIGQKWRSTVSVLYQVPFAIGHITLAVISYYFRDWRQFQLIISLPSLLLISYYWLVPESPRWLMAVGNVEEATKIIKQAATKNGLPMSGVEKMIVEHQKAQEGGAAAKGSLLDLLRYPKLRTYTLCMSFQWFVCGITFFGLAQYMGQVAGNIFFNVAIGGFLEIPGTIICIYSADKFGRKKTLGISQLITGIACLVIIVDMEGSTPVAMSAVGMVGMSVAFPTVYLYSGEIFPTVVRNVGFGVAVMSSRLGSMIAPFVSGLATYGEYFPPLVFGLLPIVASIFCLLLPETANRKLPDTIEDVEAEERSQKKEVTRF